MREGGRETMEIIWLLPIDANSVVIVGKANELGIK